MANRMQILLPLGEGRTLEIQRDPNGNVEILDHEEDAMIGVVQLCTHGHVSILTWDRETGEVLTRCCPDTGTAYAEPRR